MYIQYTAVDVLLLRCGKSIISKTKIVSFVIDSGTKMTAYVKL